MYCRTVYAQFQCVHMDFVDLLFTCIGRCSFLPSILPFRFPCQRLWRCVRTISKMWPKKKKYHLIIDFPLGLVDWVSIEHTGTALFTCKIFPNWIDFISSTIYLYPTVAFSIQFCRNFFRLPRPSGQSSRSHFYRLFIFECEIARHSPLEKFYTHKKNFNWGAELSSLSVALTYQNLEFWMWPTFRCRHAVRSVHARASLTVSHLFAFYYYRRAPYTHKCISIIWYCRSFVCSHMLRAHTELNKYGKKGSTATFTQTMGTLSSFTSTRCSLAVEWKSSKWRKIQCKMWNAKQLIGWTQCTSSARMRRVQVYFAMLCRTLYLVRWYVCTFGQ